MRASSVVTGLILAALLGACTTDGRSVATAPQMPASHASAPPRATVAFESVAGAPVPVFERLVRRLEAEAAAGRVPVVSRGEDVKFRIRAHLQARAEGGRTHVAWVYDVFDRSAERRYRLSGEEVAGQAGSDPWASVDDATLARIARTSLAGVAAFLATERLGPLPSTETAPAPAPAEPERPAAPEVPRDLLAFAPVEG